MLRCGVRGLLIELNERLQGLQGEALLRWAFLLGFAVRSEEQQHQHQCSSSRWCGDVTPSCPRVQPAVPSACYCVPCYSTSHCCFSTCRELERSYLAILDVRAAEAAHLAGRCLSEEQYRQRQVEQQQAQQQEAEQQDAEQQPSEQQAEQPVEKLSPSELLQSEQQQQQPLGEPQAVQQSS